MQKTIEQDFKELAEHIGARPTGSAHNWEAAGYIKRRFSSWKSFREDLLKQIDQVAHTESRSRSELVRQRGITEEDVEAEVAAVRAERKQRRS